MGLYSRTPLKRGNERQSHPDKVQKRIHTTVVLASLMTSFVSYSADRFEAHNVPVKDYLADLSHSELNRATEPEKSIETALQKALGKHVTVRCAKIDTSPDPKLKPENLYGFRYSGVLESDALRLSPQVCNDLAAIKNIDAAKPISSVTPTDKKTVERTSSELQAATSLGQWIVNKKAPPEVNTCHTIQRTFDVAMNLGADEFTAYKFAERIASPYQTESGRIPGCYENGPLDIDRDKSAFIPLDPPSK